MLIVEIEDSPNMGQIARMKANGFSHNEKMDYIDRKLPGLPFVEVWTKNDRKSEISYIDISDLPETED